MERARQWSFLWGDRPIVLAGGTLSPVHVAFPSRVVDKIKSGQAVISARPNWLNGTWIVHS